MNSRPGQRPQRRVARLRMSTDDIERHGMVPMAEEHFPEVVQLYGDLFGAGKRQAWADRWHWLYGEAPARKASDGCNWVLIQDCRVVGHVGFVHIRVKLGEGESRAAWGVDLMSHPDHRAGRGFLALLSTLDHAADVPMGYGMAEAVLRAYVKRGYRGRRVRSHLVFPKRPWTTHRLFSSSRPRVLRRVDCLWQALRLFVRSRRSTVAPDSSSIHETSDVEEVDLGQIPAAKLDAFWCRLSSDYAFAVVRDAAYLQWRYVALPNGNGRGLIRRRDGEIASLAIVELLRRRGLRVVQISELLIPAADRAHELPTLVDAIFRIFRHERADVLWTEGLPDAVRDFLGRRGFVELDGERREKMVYLDRNRDGTQNLEGEWLFSPGDSDRSTSYPRLPWTRVYHGPTAQIVESARMAELRRAAGAVKHRVRHAARHRIGQLLGPRARKSRQGIILVYHTVADRPLAGYPGNRVSSRHFEAHLELLRRSGRPVVSVAQILTGAASDGVALTFDDGYRGCVTEVAPRLTAADLPATFFVCPGWIDEGAGKWDDLLFLAAVRDGVPFPKASLRRSLRDVEADLESIRSRYPEMVRQSAEALMDWEDVRSLVEQGFEVGSHTLNHPFLSSETVSTQNYEMVESRRRMQAETGRDVELLAYPFGYPGSFDRHSARAAEAAGYTAALACGDRYLEPDQRPFSVPRFAIGPHTPDGWLKLVLSGHFF